MATSEVAVSGPSSPEPFPPAPYQVVARVRGRKLMLGDRGAEGYLALFSTGDDPHPLVWLDVGGKCSVRKEQVAGLPKFGFIDLNKEPDKVFGVITYSKAQESGGFGSAVHPGTRWLERFGGTAEAPLWLIAGRGEQYGLPGVPDLYVWKTNKWVHVDGGKLDYDWFFPRSFGGASGVLFVERQRLGQGVWPKWWPVRLRAIGIDKGGVVPTLSPRSDDSKCGSRITGLYTFETGEVITVGATCSNGLLVERWAKGSSTAISQEFPGVVTDSSKSGVLDPSNKGLLYSRKLEGGFRASGLGPSELEVVDKDGKRFRLAFDGTAWNAKSIDKTTDERVREKFAAYADEFRVSRVERRTDGSTWVIGTHLTDRRELALRDRPVSEACEL